MPFVVRLRSFAEGELPRPEQFVAHCAPVGADLMPDGSAHRVFRSGLALLSVDGVDEVPAARRRAVKTWLRDVLVSFPEVRVVVTTRTAAADRRWLADEQFVTVTLEPMDSANIPVFVERCDRTCAHWQSAVVVRNAVRAEPLAPVRTPA